tara:strand:+ start:18356 stop:18775 length:420 start_codon:yes stop_codon:yes gene_type:complete
MDPVHELSGMLRARLRTDTAISAFVGNRIYDEPPSGTVTSPYISMGSYSATTDDADCIDGLEITFQIDCWSWAAADGGAEVRKIAGAIRKNLHDSDFSLTTNALASISHRITRFQREPDKAGEILSRAIITVTALVEAA